MGTARGFLAQIGARGDASSGRADGRRSCGHRPTETRPASIRALDGAIDSSALDRSDSIAAFAAARSLSLERRLALDGTVTLESGRVARAELCLTRDGARLIAATDAEHGVSVELDGDATVSVAEGRLRDRLHVSGHALSVPSGKSSKALEILGIGRVRRSAPTGAVIRELRHVEPLTEVERLWLERRLESDEWLLAWLRGSDDRVVDSPILGTRGWPVRLLVTERRSELVALSPTGDARVTPFATAALRVEQRRRAIVLHVRDLAWSARSNVELHREIADVTGAPAAERLREVARLNFVHRSRSDGPFTAARPLLDAAARLGDSDAAIAVTLMTLEEQLPAQSDEALESILSGLRRQNAPQRALAELWQRWRFSAAAGIELARRLRGRELGEPWAVELHDAARAALDEAGSGSTAADIDAAEHLLEARMPARAASLLERRLALLPRRGIEDLLPPADRDLTRPSGSEEATILELLSRAKAPPDGLHADSLCALARLEPLVPERAERLAEYATGSISERARELARMFAGRDEDAPAPSRARGPSQPLDALDVTRFVKHPLAQDDTLIGRLQALLAMVPSPDPALLRDYCERLTEERHPEAARAFEEAARTLGVAGVQAYVSRGDKALGVRSYEHTPPFVLVGGRHLDPNDAFHMGAAELHFAFGAEIAHLRFGHNRVTPEEVWAGALNRTTESVDVLFGVLPVLKGWRVADHVAERMPRDALRRVITKIGEASVRRAARHAGDRSANADVLTRLNEELVAAHRLMQLSADRAGLVLSGDLRASVRAMLLVRADQPELEDLDRRGVAELVRELDTAAHVARQGLAVRLRALFSFYLSDDYARLRSAVGG